MICFNLPCAQSPKNALLFECVTMVLETLMLKVWACLYPVFLSWSRIPANVFLCCARFKIESKNNVCFQMISDLRWINIQTMGDASKLLQFGNRNRSAAATKMNQSSSRRQTFHFTISLLCHFLFSKLKPAFLTATAYLPWSYWRLMAVQLKGSRSKYRAVTSLLFKQCFCVCILL